MRCQDFEAKRCQSCGWLALEYPEQLRRKQVRAELALAPFNPECAWLAPVASATAGFRNKAKMVVGATDGMPVFGILQNAGATGAQGNVLELAHCPLYPAVFEAAFTVIRAWLIDVKVAPYVVAVGNRSSGKLAHERSGELKHLILSTDERAEHLMLRLVLRSKEPLDRIVKQLAHLQRQLPALTVVSVNLQPEHKAILEGPEEITLTQTQALPIEINGLTLFLQPQSFFQTNTAIAAQLYQRATDWLAESQPSRVLDLFCGVGGFALHAARALPSALVMGMEISENAVHAARRAAAHAKLGNVTFLAGDALVLAQKFAVLDATPASGPLCIIVNPPRRGLGPALCAWLEGIDAHELIYSSCNADSLATDLGMLPSFTPRGAQVLDMFAHTEHFEVIVRLKRKAL
jgi:23S rRNA (uracil747-C5)-methyltransferase